MAGRFVPGLYFVAVEKNSTPERIAGGALCFPTFDEDPDSGYIDTLFVNRKWRRRGLASALLSHAFNEYHRRGVYSACLGVDAASLTGAVDLYKKVGMEPVRTTDLYQLELKAGWEYQDGPPE